MSWIAKKRVPVPILSSAWRSSFVATAIATALFHTNSWDPDILVIVLASAQAASGPPGSLPIFRSDLEPSEALIPGSEQTVRWLRSVIHRIESSTKNRTPFTQKMLAPAICLSLLPLKLET